MPKLIDYPRTSYAGAWELAEVTDDTGGKCAFDTAARKLNRKVSGSFKAIIGSAVKFGLLTSKRDLLTTTTLFKRIKHAYDKQEELLFHREAFLTPPLFTQLCRKFRSRELPVQMLDVMLIREFGVEEINAQGVAKAFVEGCRAVGLLDDQNIVADIDALNAQRQPRRELASPPPTVNTFRVDHPQLQGETLPNETALGQLINPLTRTEALSNGLDSPRPNPAPQPLPAEQPALHQASAARVELQGPDAIASLFGLNDGPKVTEKAVLRALPQEFEENAAPQRPVHDTKSAAAAAPPFSVPANVLGTSSAYHIQVSGPGVNTTLSLTEEADITIALALLEKIRRQLKA